MGLGYNTDDEKAIGRHTEGICWWPCLPELTRSRDGEGPDDVMSWKRVILPKQLGEGYACNIELAAI